MTAPAETRFRTRDGITLSALNWSGPDGRTPVLCLPGLTRSARDFAILAQRQAPRRRVLALDYVGHGASERAQEVARYRVEESLRDVLDAMAALHCHRAVVVGTSFGGLIGMVMAVLRPTALAGLVMNDIGPHIEPVGTGHVRNFVGADPALPSLDATVEHLQRVLPPLRMDEAGWRRFAASAFAEGEDGRWHPRWDTRIAQAIEAGGDMPDLWPAFGALAHLPVMLVRGEVSELLSAETSGRMRREHPGLAFVEVAGVGHSPTLEEEEVAGPLDAFLDAIP